LKEKKSPPKQPKDLPILNADILMSVLEHAYFDEKLRPSFRDFTQYALVARPFRRPAQRLLFHEVSIKDEIAWKSLRNLFQETKDDYSAWLAGCVRVLNFWVFKSGMFATDWEARLPKVLTWFPQLYELRLGVDILTKLKDSTLSALNRPHSIRALQIAMRTDEDLRSPVTSVVPLQMLTLSEWTIEFLVLRGEAWNFSAYTQYPPIKHQLIEFRWSIAGAYNQVGVNDLITYVTSNSLETLENLTLPTVHPIVTKVAPTLRSLTVLTRDGIPKSLGRLRELLLLAPRGIIPKDDTFYGNLPPNIQHLGLQVDIPLPQDITELTHRLPSKVKTFSIYTSNAGYYPNQNEKRPNPKVQYDVATEVDVRMWSGGEPIKIGVRSDLIRSTVYPRSVCTDNMYAMSRAVGVDHREAKPSKEASRLKVGSTLRTLFSSKLSSSKLAITPADSETLSVAPSAERVQG
jgi:hypothetical protein